ncbi:DSC E3 ubiquitin ligase complex subunit 2 [Mycena kentingensis (nom. inval.)]|nr:DSC E3 ubiquitin ligase complex subunit 2 [Mycena kentingensis (nom. inval.)]
MSFEHAPVSKALMLGVALSSILVGIFDVTHYFHLQLVPHISRYYQYWRLPVHHLAFSSSSDLFIAETLLFNVAIQVERQFGSLKFASFAVISLLLSTILEFLSLVFLHRAGLNHIPSGPSTLIFSILYQHSRIVPSSYEFRVFGVPLEDKSLTYIFALQLALAYLPGSLASAVLGILTGQIYRSDLAGFKSWRLPPRSVAFARAYVLPLLGSLRPARRSNRAWPEGPGTANGRVSGNERAADLNTAEDEVITTARPPARPSSTSSRLRPPTAAPSSSAPNPNPNHPTIPTAPPPSALREWAEISQLTTMFPDLRREVVVGTLQRSPNIESAVETLLSSQR